MNKVYLPSHDPQSGWTLRHHFSGSFEDEFVHDFEYPFLARFVSIFVSSYRGIGMKEFDLLGVGKKSLNVGVAR